MGLVSKIKRFMSLDAATMLLFAEAFLYLGWARILILLPFSKVAPKLGVHMEETTEEKQPEHTPVLVKVHDAIQIMSQHTFWDSKCLVQAIAAMKMLARRHIESTLYMGTTRDDARRMIAHAWLRSGPYYITGAEGRERFGIVGIFAKRTVD